jgi:hypothetical protein
VFSATSGARATFTFNGTGVSWIGLPCEICGFSNVFLDGALVGTVDTYAATRPAASQVMLTRSGLASGSHTLVVEVTGTQNAASGGANVLVDAFDVTGSTPSSDTSPPTVSITSPASGATVSGTTTVSASASDNVGVAGVLFFVDGSAIGAEDTTSPYSVSWNTTTVANGSHSLTARARDAAGNSTTSGAVTVTVSNAAPSDTTPPTVSITSPASGATVSGTTTVSASASDNVGVAGVLFFVDGSAIGAEDTTSPYSASWNTTTVANGSHSLTARARDAAGNSTTSGAVTVTVSNASSGTTRFEETAATLTPSGAWSVTTGAGVGATLSGDRAVFSATSGARASFTFSGTGVSWIGLPCEICGFSNVFLDGTLVGTVDTYAATRPAASRAMFTRSGLVSGSHTLVVEATGTQNAASGGANVVVDAFDVEGSTGSGSGPRRIEETDPSVRLVGDWITHFRDDLSGGSIVEAANPGETATLTFSGTGVKFIGFRGPWAGIAEVFLDGTLRATVDTYGPVEQAQVVMYTVSGLPAGNHTIQIRVTGTWSSSSVSAWVVVDAFDVE